MSGKSSVTQTVARRPCKRCIKSGELSKDEKIPASQRILSESVCRYRRASLVKPLLYLRDGWALWRHPARARAPFVTGTRGIELTRANNRGRF